MEISEKQLLAFVTRVLQLAEQEQKQQELKKKCVIFSGSWSEKYQSFFLDGKHQAEWIGIIAKEQLENSDYMKLLTRYCSQIVLQEEAMEQKLYETECVYPVFSRELLAKAALVIPDCFEVKWMQKMLEAGTKIQIMASGLEPFTGREPSAYQERICSYIKTLLEYGIEIELEQT